MGRNPPTTLNRLENGPKNLAHGQNFPSCARDMLLVMISSLYCTENVFIFICLLEELGIILILISKKNYNDYVLTNLYLLLEKMRVFPRLYST